MNDIISQDERILAEPASQVVVAELADSSVNFIVRAWTKTSDFWAVKCDMTESIKNRFDAEASVSRSRNARYTLSAAKPQHEQLNGVRPD